MANKAPSALLGIVMLFELFLLLPWAVISLMAGMSYNPTVLNRGVFLYLLWLYPFFILLALPTAFSLRSKGKPRLAVLVALLPLLISGGVLNVL